MKLISNSHSYHKAEIENILMKILILSLTRGDNEVYVTVEVVLFGIVRYCQILLDYIINFQIATGKL